MAPLFISFSGIDGAGKSTQIEKLRKHFESHSVPVTVLTFWDHVALFSSARSGFSRKVLQSDGQVGTPEKPANRNDKNSHSWPLLAGRSALHLLDVFRLRKIVNEARQSAENNVFIFDRYMYDQLAALPLHQWLARSFARIVLIFTPKPDISYLLDAVPEEARARKPEYPIEFMRQYRNSYLELRQLASLSLIASASPEDVHAAILARLSKVVGEPLSTRVNSAVIA